MTAGPRPAGVDPVCFAPITKTPVACSPGQVGSDRLYVTFSLFGTFNGLAGSAHILFSYSDDRGHTWSPAKAIYGAAAFCVGRANNGCRDSQGSQPTVSPTTGQLWVGFLNGDTEDEDQYLVVTSTDGGNTFSSPMRVDTIYDVNEPRSQNGRTDCSARGQQGGRAVLTNSCFRMDPIMHSIVADKRGGAFANDLYVALYDNRNGTIRNSNNDVFFYKSTDGGETWIGPTRVNNDPSTMPADRDCGRNANSTSGNSALCPAAGTGNDQWFPWVTINTDGVLNVTFHDRRLDTTSPVGAGPWPTSKTVVGNYLVWFWGGTCQITSTVTVHQTTSGPVPAGAGQCVAPEAVVNPTVATGFNPGAGPIPGNNQNPATLPFKNFQVSDVPSNWDYTFRAGIFAGDYTGNATGSINPDLNKNGDDPNRHKAYGLWTDARNGRGSGGGTPQDTQPGRNPICEQSDVFFDKLTPAGGGGGAGDITRWLDTPCPLAAQDKKKK
jgi:hypothetical protein